MTDRFRVPQSLESTLAAALRIPKGSRIVGYVYEGALGKRPLSDIVADPAAFRGKTLEVIASEVRVKSPTRNFGPSAETVRAYSDASRGPSRGAIDARFRAAKVFWRAPGTLFIYDTVNNQFQPKVFPAFLLLVGEENELLLTVWSEDELAYSNPINLKMNAHYDTKERAIVWESEHGGSVYAWSFKCDSASMAEDLHAKLALYLDYEREEAEQQRDREEAEQKQEPEAARGRAAVRQAAYPEMVTELIRENLDTVVVLAVSDSKTRDSVHDAMASLAYDLPEAVFVEADAYLMSGSEFGPKKNETLPFFCFYVGGRFHTKITGGSPSTVLQVVTDILDATGGTRDGGEESDQSRESDGDGYDEEDPPLYTPAANGGRRQAWVDEDDVEEAPPASDAGDYTLTEREFAGLLTLLEGILGRMVTRGQIEAIDAKILLSRAEMKDSLLLGTILNHQETGSEENTAATLVKIVRLNELSQDFTDGLDQPGVQANIIRRFASMRAISRKEMIILLYRLKQGDSAVADCFAEYERAMDPARLLEALHDVLGPISDDDDDEDYEDDDEDYEDEDEDYEDDDEEDDDDEEVEDEDEDEDEDEYVEAAAPRDGSWEGAVAMLRGALTTRDDVSASEAKGITYLISANPPRSLVRVLQQVRQNRSDEEAVTLLISAYRQLRRDQAANATPAGSAEADDDEEDGGGYDGGDVGSVGALDLLKKTILTASLESRQEFTPSQIRILYRLASDGNPVLWAAYSLYRTSGDWDEFKDTLARLAARLSSAGAGAGEDDDDEDEDYEDEDEDDDEDEDVAQEQGATDAATMDTFDERIRSMYALEVQTSSCDREIEVIRQYQVEGFLSESEGTYLKKMVRRRDPVLMAAFDLLRETRDWRDMYDTMKRLLRREVGLQLIAKYQDHYLSAVFKLLSNNGCSRETALALMTLLEDRDETLIEVLGEYDSYWGQREGAPRLGQLVRGLADGISDAHAAAEDQGVFRSYA